VYSEEEKIRRWQEIKIRQHRLLAEADQTHPAHIEQIMKSGFTMNDIKGVYLFTLFRSKQTLLNISYIKELELHISFKREKVFYWIGNLHLMYACSTVST
jgi:hypothetical protein